MRLYPFLIRTTHILHCFHTALFCMAYAYRLDRASRATHDLSGAEAAVVGTLMVLPQLLYWAWFDRATRRILADQSRTQRNEAL